MRMMLNPFATNKYWWTCDVTKRGPGARRGLSVLLMTVLHQKDILKTSLHWKNQLGKPYTWYSSPPMGGLNLPSVKTILCQKYHLLGGNLLLRYKDHDQQFSNSVSCMASAYQFIEQTKKKRKRKTAIYSWTHSEWGIFFPQQGKVSSRYASNAPYLLKIWMQWSHWLWNVFSFDKLKFFHNIPVNVTIAHVR